MRATNSDMLQERNDTHIRAYNCPECHHEMRLTVWGTDMAA